MLQPIMSFTCSLAN